MGRAGVREAGNHGCLTAYLRAPLKPPITSHHYSIDGMKGALNVAPHCTEGRQSLSVVPLQLPEKFVVDLE